MVNLSLYLLDLIIFQLIRIQHYAQKSIDKIPNVSVKKPHLSIKHGTCSFSELQVL